jgi:hypothetical protein
LFLYNFHILFENNKMNSATMLIKTAHIKTAHIKTAHIKTAHIKTAHIKTAHIKTKTKHVIKFFSPFMYRIYIPNIKRQCFFFLTFSCE